MSDHSESLKCRVVDNAKTMLVNKRATASTRGGRLGIAAVIPASNVASYTMEAFGSALAQDPTFDEVIVIDDGSTDDTTAIVERFKDPRILYRDHDNQDPGQARNVGIALATKGYLYFMGDDNEDTPPANGYTCSWAEMPGSVPS